MAEEKIKSRKDERTQGARHHIQNCERGLLGREGRDKKRTRGRKGEERKGTSEPVRAGGGGGAREGSRTSW